MFKFGKCVVKLGLESSVNLSYVYLRTRASSYGRSLVMFRQQKRLVRLGLLLFVHHHLTSSFAALINTTDTRGHHVNTRHIKLHTASLSGDFSEDRFPLFFSLFTFNILICHMQNNCLEAVVGSESLVPRPTSTTLIQYVWKENQAGKWEKENLSHIVQNLLKNIRNKLNMIWNSVENSGDKWINCNVDRLCFMRSGYIFTDPQRCKQMV